MELVLETVTSFLSARVPRSVAVSIVKSIDCSPSVPVGGLDVVVLRELTQHVAAGLKTFAPKTGSFSLEQLQQQLTRGLPANPRRERVMVDSEASIDRALRVCQRLTRGFFSVTDETKVMTAVSELGRNIYQHAQMGELTLVTSDEKAGVTFKVVAHDCGPGIADVEQLLSNAGIGRGLRAAQAMLDTFTVRTAPRAGTTITGTKVAKRRGGAAAR